eukprot:2037445-Prymnesium_polylepis.1
MRPEVAPFALSPADVLEDLGSSRRRSASNPAASFGSTLLAMSSALDRAKKRYRTNPISFSVLLFVTVSMATLALSSPSICVPGDTKNVTSDDDDA